MANKVADKIHDWFELSMAPFTIKIDYRNNQLTLSFEAQNKSTKTFVLPCNLENFQELSQDHDYKDLKFTKSPEVAVTKIMKKLAELNEKTNLFRLSLLEYLAFNNISTPAGLFDLSDSDTQKYIVEFYNKAKILSILYPEIDFHPCSITYNVFRQHDTLVSFMKLSWEEFLDQFYFLMYDHQPNIIVLTSKMTTQQRVINISSQSPFKKAILKQEKNKDKIAFRGLWQDKVFFTNPEDKKIYISDLSIDVSLVHTTLPGMDFSIVKQNDEKTSELLWRFFQAKNLIWKRDKVPSFGDRPE